jgi:bifunctional DNA-binding transcriptional regulator/antitoxin component of YhaV-PrlF toxin-antitoxin module
MISRITGKNQVTVPASIVEKASLRPGTRLDWAVAEEGVLIVKVLPDRGTLAARLRGSGREHLRRAGGAVERLIDERASEEDTAH